MSHSQPKLFNQEPQNSNSQVTIPNGDVPIIRKTDPLAQVSSQVIRQGGEISLNGRKFPVAWSQWQGGTSVRTGISDTGAMQTLGLELLSTNNPTVQPVQWFSETSTTPIILPSRLISPYRYLDITDFAQLAGWQLQILGDTLTINSTPTQINNIRQGNQSWGKRIVVDLDRPTFWQVSQAKSEGVIVIEGIAASYLLERFQRTPSLALEEGKTPKEGEFLPSQAKSLISKSEPSAFVLESSGTKTKLHVKIPAGNGLRVFSLSNPNRIVVDIRPDALVQRDILWAPGVLWHQQFVPLNTSSTRSNFPVVWLEIDLRSSGISLKPITSNPYTLEGISPLVTTARSLQAAAAINGGFFNRNNKLPLGAIRRDGRWLSGPILNRGAIAWNNQGNVKIGRLSLQETLTTSTGNRLPIILLNSGYVKAGISRYTREWGSNYTTLTDNETIILVQNNRVTKQLAAGIARKNSFPIPADGYLLTIRANAVPARALAVDTRVNLESITVPVDFSGYPHILGAGPLLLQNRQIVLNAAAEKFSKAFQQQAAPRSAIGTTNRGTLMIAAVHNRAGGRGPTLRELAQIMQRLGAVDVLNLDGGSSTSLYLGGQLIDRSPVTAARVHNGIGIFLPYR
ncbi:MAG: phosphodiester glycosidase family protein [Xenococcaceae cyanobacterium]